MHSALEHSSLRRDERAVSEVLGVVMMLAMVITIMGGVWIFLNPYLSDFEDNTNWNSAHGLADRIEDRIDVAGASPEGTGIRHTFAMQSTVIRPIDLVESWTIAADTTPLDSVTVTHHSPTSVGIFAMNETATKITIETPDGTITKTFTPSHEEVFLTHNQSQQHWIVTTVYGEDDLMLHRHVKYTLSGVEILTNIGTGEHQLAMINNGMAEKFPDSPWKVSQFPSLEIDRLANGEFRLSLVLSDVRFNGSIPTGANVGLEMVSQGPMTLFTGQAYNVRFNTVNTLNDVITPQYSEQWLMDYNLNRASGTLEEFTGLSPWARASGADGISIDTNGEALYFEMDVMRVEVSS